MILPINFQYNRLSLEMDKLFHSVFSMAFDYLSTLGLKSIHISK